MPERAKVITTVAEIDAAIRKARLCAPYETRVLRAVYSSRTGRFVLHMSNGVVHSIPRSLMQGLSDAPSSALQKIEILGSGTGLYWPALDVAHSVAGLLSGVYGSARWMKSLHASGVVAERKSDSRGSKRVSGAASNRRKTAGSADLDRQRRA